MDTTCYNEGNNMPENNTRKNNKKLIIIIALVLLALIVGCLLLFGGKGKNLEHYLDLGDKYLEEANFDEALAAYDKALEIDDMCVEAYLGKIEVLIRTEEFDEALEVAKEGYDKTGDERLAEKIEMLESGNISDSEGRIYKETFRDADGSILGYNEYTYDYEHDGRSLKAIHYDANGKEAHSVECEYDSDGNDIVSYGLSLPEGSLINYQYDYENDRKVHSTFVFLNGSGSCEADYYYKGELVEKMVKTSYSIDNEPQVQVYTYEYDNNDKILKQTIADDDGDIWGYDLYSYDEKDNLTERKYYYKSNSYEEVTNDGFVLSSREIYTYNDEGVLIKSITYDGDGNVMSSIDYQ